MHGYLDKLKDLHGLILAHHQENFAGREGVIVHLGDYIDRGPESCETIDYLMDMEASPPAGFRTINLVGNHEQMMLSAHRGDLATRVFWLRWGGRTTQASYQRYDMSKPPRNHNDWLKALPDIVRDEAQKLIFVHAGIDPRRYPKPHRKTHIWTRAERFMRAEDWDNPNLVGKTVIHGHTPREDHATEFVGREETGYRINVDTGVAYGGKLTCVVLADPRNPVFLQV